MLAEFTHQQRIELTKNTVLTALKVGHGFVVSALVAQCDKFLLSKGISAELIGRWLTAFDCNDQDKALKVDSVEARWRFCDLFKLKQNKQKLIEQLAIQLQNLATQGNYNSGVEDCLKDLILLRDHDMPDFMFYYGASVFRTQLAIPQFLAQAWAYMKSLPMYREEMIAFSKNPANESTLAAAWLNLPADLQKERSKDQ